MVARHKSKQQKTQINQQNVLHEKCCSTRRRRRRERPAPPRVGRDEPVKKQQQKNNPKKGQEDNCENDRADANRTRARFSVFKSNMGSICASACTVSSVSLGMLKRAQNRLDKYPSLAPLRSRNPWDEKCTRSHFP